MKPRPITFAADEVRAALDGRKTQFRRVVKPQPPYGCCYTINGAHSHALCFSDDGKVCVPPTAVSTDHRILCPFGVVGDKLWVRESLRPSQSQVVVYVADGIPVMEGGASQMWNWQGRYRRPQHMPRWANRLALEVTAVRVERVHEISTDDVGSEGIQVPNIGSEYEGEPPDPWTCFADTWNARNAKKGHGWDANPWVWVVEFERVEDGE